MKLLLIIISMIPVILLGLYIYNKDSVKEPKSLLLILFSSGLLASFLVIIINIIIALLFPDLYLSENYSKFGFFKLFLLIFLEVALVEEFCKWIMIRTIGYPHKDFDQLYSVETESGTVTVKGKLYETDAALYFISDNFINCHRLTNMIHNNNELKTIVVNEKGKTFKYNDTIEYDSGNGKVLTMKFTD